ncbi:selenoneine biosynthesis selenosugar synthase SenB [Polynucleobacter sp. AM-26B4]|uniref:selenoneine biosynthesis selenosugar synthase SenB n=1 Tax=Polynucleobacter sp. AM-26B4 TaxID=2689103 RepID=UPI001C0DA7F2|nr:selenoneine biosynthesis selenosugar synthase SenB [Polynucleobacter sp. AM-26B4]MBU3585758.1 TIGR04348 family glycosyltransferase [Polynucleobacter sp. AM-26B4]
MSNIEIVTPAPAGSLHGNRITALRWQSFLKKLSHQVRVSNQWTGKDTDLLIALHAYRSHASIVQFRKKYPNQPIILILTGTDLYRDMASHAEVIKSMEMSDAIVILQSAALAMIPKHLQTKTHVIYQSTKPVKRKALLKKSFLISVIGHLRSEKDPFCTAKSLKYLGPESKIKVIHMGKAMSPEMKSLAKAFNKELKNYQWLDELSHSETLQQLSRSHLMVISSLMEGGAHVVTEAIAIGVPIIASDIPGNRGLLGDDYPGYYQVGDEKALAKILQKTESNAAFYQSLEKHIKKRKEYVRPEFELNSIKALLNRLIK